MHGSEISKCLGAAFPVRDSIKAGEGRKRYGGRHSPFWGVRATKEATAEESFKALMKRLPDHAFAVGETAARLHGLPMPVGSDHDTVLAIPQIGVPKGKPKIRAYNISSRQMTLQNSELTVQNGVRITTLERTWYDLSLLWDNPAFLAVTDYLVHVFRQPSSITKLEQQHLLHRGPGVIQRQKALEWTAPRVDSPMESVLRFHLLQAGLPNPVCNPTVWIPDVGTLRPDLFFPETLLIIEYNGEYHGNQGMRQSDEMRKRRLEAAGFKVITVVAQDLQNPQNRANLIDHIRQELQNGHDRRLKPGVFWELRYF